MSTARPRTGRRPGPSASRAAILRAARDRFARLGYDRATIRGIAADAGVDPALVHHFFGTKDRLFTATVELPVDPAEAIDALAAPGLDGLGERLVRFYLTLWESDSAPAMHSLLRSAVSQAEAAQVLRGFVGREVVGALAARLHRPDGQLRATLVGAQLVGLGVVRYVVGLEPLASASLDEVVHAVGPTVQRYLTADTLDGTGPPGRVDSGIHQS